MLKLGEVIDNLINNKYETDMAEIIDKEYETAEYTYVATKMTEKGKEYFKDIFNLPIIEIENKFGEIYITINSGKLIDKVNYFLQAQAGYINSEKFNELFILD